MAKATYLKDLIKAYETERIAFRMKTFSTYKNKSPSRWKEVAESHNRKVVRRCRRSVGNSNKLRVRKTALGLARALREINMLAQVFRGNRVRHAAQEQK